MSKSKSKSFTSIVIHSLGWPLFWGVAATIAFYLLIGFGYIRSGLVARYFAGHPVEYIETGLFFVGLMALIMKASDLASQFRVEADTRLTEPVAADRDEVATAGKLLKEVNGWRTRIRETYLAQRIANALRSVQRNESANDLDEQLRHLSDVDAERSHDGYALVRMIVWATPMLGFLGTVIGITMALGNLSPEALVDAPKDAMQGLLAGLSVAFDTTALALSLSIVLMFVQYIVREVETQLLGLVDRRAEDELMGRFQMMGSSKDPSVSAVRHMSERVLDSVKQLTERQSDALSTALSNSQNQWMQSLQTTNEAVQSGFQFAIRSSMASHAEALTEVEEKTGKRMSERWEAMHAAMLEQTVTLNDQLRNQAEAIRIAEEKAHDRVQQVATLMTDQHREINRQGDIMQRVIEATGEIRTLESALNQNLKALAGSKNFEDTVMSLSAAIQLLTARLGVAKPGLQLQQKKDVAA